MKKIRTVEVGLIKLVNPQRNQNPIVGKGKEEGLGVDVNRHANAKLSISAFGHNPPKPSLSPKRLRKSGVVAVQTEGVEDSLRYERFSPEDEIRQV